MSEDFDNTQAESEGWRLALGSGVASIGAGFESRHKLRGFRWHMTLHQADELARQFVKDKAAEGSAYHIDALARTQLL